MNYFLNENLVKMGKECIHKSSGLIITRTFYDYQCLLYQDIVESVRYVNSDLKKTNSFPYRRYTIKISGLSGKYKIITRKFCNKDGTFYTEWKKMGSPKYITEEEKEYLDARIRPALEVEFVEIFNEFEKNINLDVFEMAFIEIKKLYFNMQKVLIISLFISLFIECSQVTLSMIIPNFARTFDTMDLICNSISGLIGYRLYLLYSNVIVDNVEVVDSMEYRNHIYN